MEEDVDLCMCVQFVLQLFFVVGLEGVYCLYVFNLDGCVFDVLVISLCFCEVLVIVFLCEGDGIVLLDFFDCVVVSLCVDDVCLFIDLVIVCGVEILCYQVDVIIYIFFGFDFGVVLQFVFKCLVVYVEVCYWFGCEVIILGVYVVLYVEGVECVELCLFIVNIIVDVIQVLYCMVVDIKYGGICG